MLLLLQYKRGVVTVIISYNQLRSGKKYPERHREREKTGEEYAKTDRQGKRQRECTLQRGWWKNEIIEFANAAREETMDYRPSPLGDFLTHENIILILYLLYKYGIIPKLKGVNLKRIISKNVKFQKIDLCVSHITLFFFLPL